MHPLFVGFFVLLYVHAQIESLYSYNSYSLIPRLFFFLLVQLTLMNPHPSKLNMKVESISGVSELITVCTNWHIYLWSRIRKNSVDSESTQAGASLVGQPLHTRRSCTPHRCTCMYLLTEEGVCGFHDPSVSSTTSVLYGSSCSALKYAHMHAGGPFIPARSNETAGSLDRGSIYPWRNGQGIQTSRGPTIIFRHQNHNIANKKGNFTNKFIGSISYVMSKQ